MLAANVAWAGTTQGWHGPLVVRHFGYPICWWPGAAAIEDETDLCARDVLQRCRLHWHEHSRKGATTQSKH